MADKYTFVILKGPNPGSTIILNDDEITMGRDKSNSLHIDDAALSRSHARLVRTSSGYTLQDLGSTNGTFVNDSVVSALYPLKDRDRISIGETIVLEYHKESGAGETNAPKPMPASENMGNKTKVLSGMNRSGANPIEKNVALVQRFFQEVWNKGNLNMLDELLTQDFEDHGQPPGTPSGHEAIKSLAKTFHLAFPDLLLTLDQNLAENDHVANRFSVSGTHQGDFMGIASTGKQVSFGGMTFMRIQDDKIAESWGSFDIPGLMHQLSAGAE